ncbi:hypothetical protein C8024_12405 [Sphingopyxis sp. BSNA05]|uniref:hypothetical protein n=1 Tax=Sphingopyxis sp. BSNA05 TaxID=1236614 RepID=UPI001565C2C7|nr:hypothetical protein [Sphingopyxis sp. BSNA05]NRD90092.1 hypothetical protein [Sphingopyxis sp. BSNA05]
MKTEYSRLFRYSSLVPLSILAVMIVIILPALASEAFATDPAAEPQNANATAVATARIVKPFTMTSGAQGGTEARNSEIAVSHSTTYHSCEILLGADDISSPAQSCELHLVELH